MNTLPFGAAAAVHHFNRVSRLLWAVGTKSLLVPWANYFDDFPVVLMSQSGSTLGSVKTMLKILGFEYAEDKLEPFSREAEMLGRFGDGDAGVEYAEREVGEDFVVAEYHG